MWAQLIKVRVRPGFDLTTIAEVLKRFEQPGSGLGPRALHAGHQGCGFGLRSRAVRE